MTYAALVAQRFARDVVTLLRDQLGVNALRGRQDVDRLLPDLADEFLSFWAVAVQAADEAAPNVLRDAYVVAVSRAAGRLLEAL